MHATSRLVARFRYEVFQVYKYNMNKRHTASFFSEELTRLPPACHTRDAIDVSTWRRKHPSSQSRTQLKL